MCERHAREDRARTRAQALIEAQLRELEKIEGRAERRALLRHYQRARAELLRKVRMLGPGKLTPAHVLALLVQLDAAIAVMAHEQGAALRAESADAVARGWAAELARMAQLEARRGDPAIAARMNLIRPVIPASTVQRIGDAQTLLLRRFGAATRQKVADELAQAVLQGESTAQAGRRLRQVLKARPFELTRIARTEINLATNEGHMGAIGQVAEAFPELGLQKQWSSHLDSRTSPRCRGLNGVVVAWDANFTAHDGWSGPYPPAHPNCRSRVQGYAVRWGGKRPRQTARAAA